MPSYPPQPQRDKSSGANRSVIRGLVIIAVFILILMVVFFGCAGRLDRPAAWAYFIFLAINTGIVSLIMDPELIAERSKVGEGTKRWDIIPAFIIGRVSPLAILIVAGLDVRFEWSPPIPLYLQIMALIPAILGMVLVDWAVLANRFFSGVVRIQKERGHRVVTDGPYRYIRHPGYTGTIIYNLFIPIVLNSWWTFIPAGLVAAVTVIRTVFEDRTLRAELEGYQDYASRVRRRLIPGLW